MKLIDVMDAIDAGTFDSHLDRLMRVAVERKREIARLELGSIRIGDSVRFTAKCNPAYMRGLQAQVKKVNGASVVVDIANDPAYGRFAGKKNVRCPASIVEKV